MIVDTDNLISPSEIAEWTGKSKQAVTNWQLRYKDFPEPVMYIGKSDNKLFLKDEVEKWLRRRGKLKEEVNE